MKRLKWIHLAGVIAAAIVFCSVPIAARAQSVPYYFRQLTAQSAVSQTFAGMQGQGTCQITISSVGGANTTLSQVIATSGISNSTPLQLYDGNGNPLGTQFSTIAQQSVWFNCTNAVSVVATIAPAGTYAITFIATPQAWSYGFVFQHTGSFNGANLPNQYADYWPDALGLLSTATITAAGTTLQLTGVAFQHWYVYYAGCQAQGALTTPTCMFEGGSGGSCGTNTKPVFPSGIPGPTAAGNVVPVYAGSSVGTQTAPAAMVPADKPLILASGANGCWVFAGTLTNGITGTVYAVLGW